MSTFAIFLLVPLFAANALAVFSVRALLCKIFGLSDVRFLSVAPKSADLNSVSRAARPLIALGSGLAIYLVSAFLFTLGALALGETTFTSIEVQKDSAADGILKTGDQLEAVN